MQKYASAYACSCVRAVRISDGTRLLTPQFVVVAAALRLSAATAGVTYVASVVGSLAQQGVLKGHKTSRLV